MTPYKLWLGKKAAVDHIKVFGTECFAHIPKQKYQKWDKKAVKNILVGTVATKKATTYGILQNKIQSSIVM